MTCIRRPYARWTTCRCEPCRTEMARLAKLARNGRLPRASSEAAWRVIDELLAAGWTGQAIASAAGITPHSIESALTDRRGGHARRFGPTYAAKILNHGQPTRGHIGAAGTTRRLQALARIGWSLDEIHARTGIPVMTLSITRAARNQRVRPALAVKVADVYRDLEMTPGPSMTAARRAASLGWAPPLAWDEGTIDDPNARPVGVDDGRDDAIDDAAVERACAGDRTVRLTNAERREVVARLAGSGLSDQDIARRTGINDRQVIRDRQRAGIPANHRTAAA